MLLTLETSTLAAGFVEKMSSEILVASYTLGGEILPESLKMSRKNIVSSGLHGISKNANYVTFTY